MKKYDLRSICMWILGMIICPLGVAFCTRAGLGVSMIEAPVYVLHLKLSEFWSWFTFGTSEYFLQGIVILILCLSIRRFYWRYLLSFATAVIFGLILDGWNLLIASESLDPIVLRIIFCAIGALLTSFAVACFFRTSLPQEAWELFVKELTEHFHLNMTKVKWIYDLSSLGLGILLMLIFFGRFEWSAIGAGTIVMTLINAPIIGFFGKVIDKVWKPTI